MGVGTSRDITPLLRFDVLVEPSQKGDLCKYLRTVLIDSTLYRLSRFMVDMAMVICLRSVVRGDKLRRWGEGRKAEVVGDFRNTELWFESSRYKTSFPAELHPVSAIGEVGGGWRERQL